MDHKYADWEFFGRFICEQVAANIDFGELDTFIRAWSHGEWSILDEEWPEWVQFVKDQGR